jgi:hypothetical protein
VQKSILNFIQQNVIAKKVVHLQKNQIMKNYKLFLLSLLITFTFACKPSVKQRTLAEQNSFCYWNTSYNTDTVLINATETNHYYIRYFDVDWDDISQEGKPIASLSSYDIIPVKFTPSVFLTNKIFEKSTNPQLKILSERIKKRVEQITTDFGKRAFYKEYGDGFYYYGGSDSIRKAEVDSAKIAYANAKKVFMNNYMSTVTDVLIDCDWTAGTQDKFFYFIECLKKDFADKEITVTLRLWQYKRNKPEDIPPVNRCLLMCYNMQAFNDYRVENSIASFEELKKYVSGKKYPLKLDVALPIFNWAILFRNERFMGILGNVNRKDYDDNFIEYESLGNGRYCSLVDKVIGDFFIRKGDIIKIEEVSKEELHQMAEYLKSEIDMDEYSRITFFSWNKLYINNYGTDEIKNIRNVFSN